ncbi:hypothetical protein BJ878DRAFT_478234 [Calycina marina]|uniref:3'-5' exonuclease domain-containing protein n=1 Tax=Calycina marina TaxID=1763456 RepID=A0A9P7Z7S4_9HELO|nr:hypothetical protein BJ878DRAFT_478234 [Calycina marina]
MPTTMQQMDLTIFYSIQGMLHVLDNLDGLPVDPPSLYFDLEVIRLGKLETLSFMLLHVQHWQTAYLIDVHNLGSNAFSTTNSTNSSLKSILESPIIPEIVFDIRKEMFCLHSNRCGERVGLTSWK